MNPNDRDAWLALLARWGLVTALVVVGLVTTFFAAVAAVSSQPGFGGAYDEVLMAAFTPVLYRVSMTFDALGWLAMGGLVVILGLAASQDAPVRGRLAAALGITAITGVIGAFLRMTVVGDLGRQFVAAEAGRREEIIELYRSIDWIIAAHFGAGQLTVGLGLVVVGSAALRLAWVPRIIAWLTVLPGITSLTLLVGAVVLDVFLFPVLLVHVVLLALLGVAAARAWWRGAAPSPAGTSPLEPAHT